MIKRNVLLLSILCLFLSACSATGPVFTAPEAPSDDSEAIVYIYRPDRFMLGGAAPNIDVNGEFMFPLKNNGFNLVRLPPGSYIIAPTTSATWGSYPSPKLVPTELRVEGGESYFLRLDFDEAGLSTSNINDIHYKGQVQLSVVDSGTARIEMVGTKRSD